MAVNVLIIPEDFRKDQYVLKPIIEKMFAALHVKAKVQVCRDPLLGGVGEAMKWERIEEILARYRGMIRVFLLLVDRDGLDGRRAQLDGLEVRAATELGGLALSQAATPLFFAQEAHQEVEVWVLAGLDSLPKKWSWKSIRAHRDPKEAYYDAIAKDRGLLSAPYEGRIELAREAASRYSRIRQLCAEDVGALEDRIRAALESSP